ncbi:HAMP domain-containing protein, partial [candidate division KSB1 bacterium]|nr:HAMP domain-containing protein [candidate division KSB1 bacterium]
IPLTFFMSVLLSKSSEMLMQPGIEEALRLALNALHDQLDHTGEQLWSQDPQLATMPSVEMQRLGIQYIGRVGWEADSCRFYPLQQADPSHPVTPADIWPENLAAFQNLDRQGILFGVNQEHLYQYHRLDSDTCLYFLSYIVPQNIIDAKDQLDRAVKNYASFGLLRDTFFEQGLVWAMAVLLILLLSLIAIWTARGLSRQISQPIQALTAAMQQVGSGDLSRRVQVAARDELTFLISSFNRMAEDLQNSRANLQRAERVAAWRDAARQVSHELKNPLTPIQLSLFRLRSTLPPEAVEHPDCKEAFRIIEEELTSMRRLADEFSEFARMPTLTFKPALMQDIIRQTVQLVEAENPAIKIESNLENTRSILVDCEQIRRALHNLLKNAAEASSPGDAIHVSLKNLTDHEKQLQIVIRDQGCGMDADTLQKATEAYFTTKKHGSGLGLLIAQRIIFEHQGRMRIESRAGKGTTVYIDL